MNDKYELLFFGASVCLFSIVGGIAIGLYWADLPEPTSVPLDELERIHKMCHDAHFRENSWGDVENSKAITFCINKAIERYIP